MTNNIRIVLVSGKDLPSMDNNGLSDPYVILKLGGEKTQKSKVVTASLNPEWNETFTFEVKKPELDFLEMRVMDWDRLKKDDHCGDVNLKNLETLPDGLWQTMTLPLTGENAKGTLTFRVRVMGFGTKK